MYEDAARIVTRFKRRYIIDYIYSFSFLFLYRDDTSRKKGKEEVSDKR